MERARVAETELMPRLVVGYNELGCSKWKKGKGFLKPNFGVGPSLAAAAVVRTRSAAHHRRRVRLVRRVYLELLPPRGAPLWALRQSSNKLET